MRDVPDSYAAAANAATRELPHSIEAEQSLLGAILIDNRALDRVTAILDADHFFDPLHARIFSILRSKIESGSLANPMTIAPAFETAVHIAPGLSVLHYLGKLAVNATTTLYAKDYAQAIRDYATRRSLITIGQTMAHDGFTITDDMPSKAIIEAAEHGLYELAEKGTYGKGSISIGQIVDGVIDDANDAHIAGGRPTGIQTGFRDLDVKLCGLQPGNLIILAGRPSMGKTALAINIGYKIAKTGTPVQFDSMEMAGGELGLRILAEESSINGNEIKRGSIRPEQFYDLKTARQRIVDVPMFIDDAGGLTIGKLAARARRLKRQRNIGCLIVDYLQLMAGGSNNRVADVTDITTGLKALAKDLGIPIIALSQLSRKCEERTDKRPQLADLRDSGSIEQDADVVLFVYRDEYYVERAKPDENDFDAYTAWSKKMKSSAGKAEVIIAKHRSGSCGIINMHFDPTLTRFSNLAADVHPSVGMHQ